MLQYSHPRAQPPVEVVFHALSDANRRAMIDRLLDGPASVSELGRPLAISLPAVVQHLHVLEASGARLGMRGSTGLARFSPGEPMSRSPLWSQRRQDRKGDRNEQQVGDTY